MMGAEIESMIDPRALAELHARMASSEAARDRGQEDAPHGAQNGPALQDHSRRGSPLWIDTIAPACAPQIAGWIVAATLAGVLAIAAGLPGCAKPSYLGASLPDACAARDVERCLGWMVERDLTQAELVLAEGAALRRYVQTVADRLSRAAELPHAPRVVITDRTTTYATSGGRIVLGRLTLERLGSEAELAAVIAHELAHLEGAHAVVSLFGPPPDDDWLVVRRDAEAVADERAVALLERAGYDPGAMARALRAVLDAEDDEHPLRADRIARVAVMARAAQAASTGFEGRAELLAQLEHMVVGRDLRLGHRVGDAWVLGALGLAIELRDGDVVREAEQMLVVRRRATTMAAYALGAGWARELAASLDDRIAGERPLGRITIGTIGEPSGSDRSPLGKLAHASRSALPQPPVGTRVAIIERGHGALLIELGGRGLADLGLREARTHELIASEPARIVLERAARAGTAGASLACTGRLLDDPLRRVAAGDRLKCSDRTAVVREQE